MKSIASESASCGGSSARGRPRRHLPKTKKDASQWPTSTVGSVIENHIVAREKPVLPNRLDLEDEADDEDSEEEEGEDKEVVAFFRVDGMTCGGCVTTVTNVISGVPGVNLVDVSLSRNAAAVVVDLRQYLNNSVDNFGSFEAKPFQESLHSNLPTVSDVEDEAKIMEAMKDNRKKRNAGKSSKKRDALRNARKRFDDAVIHALEEVEFTAFATRDESVGDYFSDMGNVDSDSEEAAAAADDSSKEISDRAIYFHVEGMTCPSCTFMVKTALGGVDGVQLVVVDLERKAAVAVLDIEERSKAMKEKKRNDDSTIVEDDEVEDLEGAESMEELVRDAVKQMIAAAAELDFQVSEANDAELVAFLDKRRQVEEEQLSKTAIALGQSSGGSATGASASSSGDGSSASSSSHAINISDSLAEGEIAMFRVGGMTCASCVATIESYLKTVDGIRSVSVTLLTEQAEVEFDPSSGLDENKIKAAIEEIGFTASPMERQVDGRVTLSVDGIHCPSCVHIIETSLKKKRGVRSVSVNAVTRQAKIEFDNYALGVRDLIAYIESAGPYTAKFATPEDNLESLGRVKDIAKWRRKFLLSLLFTVPLLFVSMILDMLIGPTHKLLQKDFIIRFVPIVIVSDTSLHNPADFKNVR
jgi:copper ion binding protein